MTHKEADAYYEYSLTHVVGMYYYGHVSRDDAFANFKAICQEKSYIPLLDDTINNEFEAVLSSIIRQRMEIEGSENY